MISICEISVEERVSAFLGWVARRKVGGRDFHEWIGGERRGSVFHTRGVCGEMIVRGRRGGPTYPKVREHGFQLPRIRLPLVHRLDPRYLGHVRSESELKLVGLGGEVGI